MLHPLTTPHTLTMLDPLTALHPLTRWTQRDAAAWAGVPPPPPPPARGGSTLRHRGTRRWVWEVGLGNYMAWVGGVHAGLRLKLRGNSAAFDSPLHQLSEADLRTTPWHNAGRGHAELRADAALVAISGDLDLAPAEVRTSCLEIIQPLTTAPYYTPYNIPHYTPYYTSSHHLTPGAHFSLRATPHAVPPRRPGRTLAGPPLPSTRLHAMYTCRHSRARASYGMHMQYTPCPC